MRPLVSDIAQGIAQDIASPIEGFPAYQELLYLFDANEQGLLFPSVNQAIADQRLYQDAAGTTLASAVNDPVGKGEDYSGNGNDLTQTTATARCLLKQTAGGDYYLEFDETDNEYDTTLPAISNGTAVLIGTNGIWIDDAFNHAGGTWTIGYNGGNNNYTGGPNGILTTVGGLLGGLVIDRQLTAGERQAVIDYGLSVGAPGWFVEEEGLLVNGAYDADSDWFKASGVTIGAGVASFSSVNTATALYQSALPGDAVEGDIFIAGYDVVSRTGGTVGPRLGSVSSVIPYPKSQVGEYRDVLVYGTNVNNVFIFGCSSFTGSLDNASLRKLTLVTP